MNQAPDNDRNSPPPISVDLGNTEDVHGTTAEEVDAGVQALIGESDKAYREITGRIIDISEAQLSSLGLAKNPLRNRLSIFIMVLLSVQFIILGMVLFFNSFWELKISDLVIDTYIVSVFAETLAGLIVMIKFAFNSEEETKSIQILNSIVEHFQKYNGQ